MYRITKRVASSQLVLALALASVFAVLLLQLQTGKMSSGVLVWWTALFVVSAFNIWMWRLSAESVARRKDDVEPAVHLYRRRQLLLCCVYVAGCAFRAMLPRADVQRIGLFDLWVSSVLVGRSVATVAELCFVAQWALMLNALGKETGARTSVVISWLIVPLIAGAEVFSWYGVLTTAYIGNSIEESIWALTALLLIVGLVSLWGRCDARYRPFLAAGLLLGVCYVTFMCTVDVPMYVSRWLADEANGRQYLSLAEGLWDVGSRWTVEHSWEPWHPEIPWMSLYFSVAVWCSLALVHVPPRLRRDTSVEGAQRLPA